MGGVDAASLGELEPWERLYADLRQAHGADPEATRLGACAPCAAGTAQRLRVRILDRAGYQTLTRFRVELKAPRESAERSTSRMRRK